MLNKKRSVRLWPVPPPFRNHGNYVVSVAELNRWLSEKAEEAGAYILTETTGHKLLVEDDKVVGVRTGDKGRDKYGGREGQLRARLRRDGQGDRARRGLLGPPDRRGAEGPRPGGQRPAGLGARRQGGLGGREAAGQGHPHARLAAAPAGEVPGVRRLVDLRHEPRGREAEGVDRVRVRARQRRRADLGPRPAAGVQAPPARQEDPRGRQARRLGREGDPGGRLLGAPAPAPPRHGHLRRRRRHGQRAQAEGDPLRDRVRAARRGDDLQAAQGRLVGLLGVRDRPCTRATSARTSTSRAT